MTMRTRLAVFDVDGTLIDSIRLICAAMDDAFDMLGMPAPPHRATRRIVGLSLHEAVARLAPEGCAEQVVFDLAEAYRANFVENRARGLGEGEAPLFSGARAALDRLAGSDALLAVATGKARRGLDHMFAAHDMGHLFAVSQTADDAPGKPHPGMVLNCLAATGVAARDAVMIGDTSFDIEMGKNAGCRAIGVAWGYHEVEDLRAAGADEIIHNFDALDAALARAWGLPEGVSGEISG